MKDCPQLGAGFCRHRPISHETPPRRPLFSAPEPGGSRSAKTSFARKTESKLHRTLLRIWNISFAVKILWQMNFD
jgi:hypothetical protein